MATITVESGIKFKGSTDQGIKKVLLKWIFAHEKYANVHKKESDVAYFYNERANVSILAAAAWLSGFVAVEEYVTEKYHKGGSENGRADLYISGRNWNIDVEAKQKWPRAHQSNDKWKVVVKEALDQAVEEAARMGNSGRRYGAAFYGPAFSKQKYGSYENDSELIIEREIKRYIEFDNFDIIAWCFPVVSRGVVARSDNMYYPGVILELKEVPARR